MNAYRVLTIIVLISLSSSSSWSEDSKADYTKAFEMFGYSVDAHTEKSHCAITMNLDQKKLTDNFELLKKLGIFNSELPKSTVNKKPFTISSAFLFQMLPLVAKNTYESNEAIDKCTFMQSMSVIDDYGNDENFQAISFNFSRSLFKKINWDNFDSKKVPVVFPSFKFSPELSKKLAEESE